MQKRERAQSLAEFGLLGEWIHALSTTPIAVKLKALHLLKKDWVAAGVLSIESDVSSSLDSTQINHLQVLNSTSDSTNPSVQSLASQQIL
mgnify:CR=1 FL=1